MAVQTLIPALAAAGVFGMTRTIAVVPKLCLERCDADAGHDREEERVGSQRAVHRMDLLGLHREDDEVRVGHAVLALGRDA